MLEDKDIQKLTDILATKEDLDSLVSQKEFTEFKTELFPHLMGSGSLLKI